jgi:hypothetical protein
MKSFEVVHHPNLPDTQTKIVNSRLDWTPISMSSGSSDDDEKYDKVEGDEFI